MTIQLIILLCKNTLESLGARWIEFVSGIVPKFGKRELPKYQSFFAFAICTRSWTDISSFQKTYWLILVKLVIYWLFGALIWTWIAFPLFRQNLRKSRFQVPELINHEQDSPWNKLWCRLLGKFRKNTLFLILSSSLNQADCIELVQETGLIREFNNNY